MTEQEWLEARARGLKLRRHIEEGMTRALIESGIMKDCVAYIQAAEQSVQPTGCYACADTGIIRCDGIAVNCPICNSATSG